LSLSPRRLVAFGGDLALVAIRIEEESAVRRSAREHEAAAGREAVAIALIAGKCGGPRAARDAADTGPCAGSYRDCLRLATRAVAFLARLRPLVMVLCLRPALELSPQRRELSGAEGAKLRPWRPGRTSPRLLSGGEALELPGELRWQALPEPERLRAREGLAEVAEALVLVFGISCGLRRGGSQGPKCLEEFFAGVVVQAELVQDPLFDSVYIAPRRGRAVL
jgi:hypothetical protein